MGLFNFIKGQLINVIEWTGDTQDDLMVYRFPVDGKEIKNGAQLTVRESQVAIFVNEGEICDVFQPGRYQLTTANLPILTKIQSWKYLNTDSPFKAEVYFVNTKQFTGIKWGTSNPFTLRDADFGMCRIKAFGTYSVKVDNAALFLKEVFGTVEKYKVSYICDYIKSMVVSSFTDYLAEQKTPVLDIPTLYEEIGEGAKVKVLEKVSTLGLTIPTLIVENVSLPEAVEKAIDERSSMGALGNMNTYTQYKAANAIEDAAKNTGGMAGAGVGIGAGFGFGGMMANTMNTAFNSQNQQPQEAKVICPHCGKEVKSGSKFCPECGKELVVAKIQCVKCGKEIPANSKFCPECGATQAPSKCPKCNATLAPGAKFCPECGEKIN